MHSGQSMSIESPAVAFHRGVAVLMRAMLALVFALVPVMGFCGEEDDEEEEREITEAEVLRFAQDHIPRMYTVLQEVKGEEPEEYEELIDEGREIIDVFRYFTEFDRDLAPVFLKLHRMEWEMDVLTERVHDAPNEEARKAATEACRKHIAEIFDLELKLERAEIRMLQREIEELTQLIKKREENREKEIEEQLHEWLDDMEDEGDDDDEWEEHDDDDDDDEGEEHEDDDHDDDDDMEDDGDGRVEDGEF